jgi:hypothetical protein
MISREFSTRNLFMLHNFPERDREGKFRPWVTDMAAGSSPASR